MAVAVGLLFLVLTIWTLAVCQRGQKVTNVALLNLCLSLFLAHLSLLLTQQQLGYLVDLQVSLLSNASYSVLVESCG